MQQQMMPTAQLVGKRCVIIVDFPAGESQREQPIIITMAVLEEVKIARKFPPITNPINSRLNLQRSIIKARAHQGMYISVMNSEHAVLRQSTKSLCPVQSRQGRAVLLEQSVCRPLIPAWVSDTGIIVKGSCAPDTGDYPDTVECR